MGSRVALALAGILISAAPAVAQQAPPVVQVASGSGWTTSQMGTLCEVRHPLGPDAGAALGYRQSYRGNGEPFMLFTSNVRWTPKPTETGYVPSSATVDLFWEDGSKAGTGTAFRYDLERAEIEPGRQTMTVRLNDAAEERLAIGAPADAALIVEIEGAEVARYPAGGIVAPRDELTACFADLGLVLMAARPAGEVFNGEARGPVPRTDPARWITTSDYPSRAIRTMEQGRTVIAASVNRYGIVTGCRVAESSGSAILDEASCKSIERRARFYPARNAEDEAVDGVWTKAIVWAIPE